MKALIAHWKGILATIVALGASATYVANAWPHVGWKTPVTIDAEHLILGCGVARLERNQLVRAYKRLPEDIDPDIKTTYETQLEDARTRFARMGCN